MSRAGLVAVVTEVAAAPRACPILHALEVGCGAAAVGITSEELAVGLFRRAARCWFARMTHLSPREDVGLIQGAAVQ